jgi:RNA exonuclease 4
MARRRRKNCSSHAKIPGATNWKMLCDKIDKEKTGIVKKKLKKISCINIPTDHAKLNDVTAISDVIDVNEKDQNKSVHGKRRRKTKPLSTSTNKSVSTNITHRLALDCEMVGCGKDGVGNQLARVSIVNIYGDIVYDKIVLPRENVTDYRSLITGLNREIITTKGVPFKEVQGEVADMVKDKVVIGHDIKHDFDVLEFSHPKSMIRDTAKYKPFKALSKGNTPSLKKLCREILKTSVQEGAHDSIEDARGALQLYRMHRTSWERSIKKRKKKSQEAMDSQENNNDLNDSDDPL